jgi:hypothetical protein
MISHIDATAPPVVVLSKILEVVARDAADDPAALSA